MKSEGRMIRKDISRSHKIGSLSPKSLALFTLMIPHFNAHGKMNGSPYFIKGEVCPLVDWLDIEDIVVCMKEITKKTNVKHFVANGLPYIHSVNFGQHQALRTDRMGEDNLPSYSCTDPGDSGSTPAEVKLSKDKLSEVEVKSNPGVVSELKPIVPPTPPTPQGSSASAHKSGTQFDVMKQEEDKKKSASVETAKRMFKEAGKKLKSRGGVDAPKQPEGLDGTGPEDPAVKVDDGI